MATGNYLLGATAKIPIQLTLDNIPYPGWTPVVEKIIKPNGTLMPGFPIAATVIDEVSATFVYSFAPDMVGDYIVLIKTTVDDQDYYSYDNFTVTNGIKSAPRAEPK